MKPKAFIFDLDGVITDTAYYHFLAWKALAEELGYHFDLEMNEKLKGVSRIRSFEIILQENNAIINYTEEEKEVLANKKNDLYVELIKQVKKEDILPGIITLLADAKAMGIPCAVASASKNAFTVLDLLGIREKFAYIADANLIKHAKPHPEVFLDCIKALGVEPAECIGFEDAEAGIEAIHAAGMCSVGINVVSEKVEPILPLGSTQAIKIEEVLDTYHNWMRSKCS